MGTPGRDHLDQRLLLSLQPHRAAPPGLRFLVHTAGQASRRTEAGPWACHVAQLVALAPSGRLHFRPVPG